MEDKVRFLGWFSYTDVIRVNKELKKFPVFQKEPNFLEAPFDKAHIELLTKELLDNNYVICGDTHQSEEYNCIPVFNDGYLFLSMRTWAEVMAEVMNIKVGAHTNKYSYADFVMADLCSYDESLPKD